MHVAKRASKAARVVRPPPHNVRLAPPPNLASVCPFTAGPIRSLELPIAISFGIGIIAAVVWSAVEFVLWVLG